MESKQTDRCLDRQAGLEVSNQQSLSATGKTASIASRQNMFTKLHKPLSFMGRKYIVLLYHVSTNYGAFSKTRTMQLQVKHHHSDMAMVRKSAGTFMTITFN